MEEVVQQFTGGSRFLDDLPQEPVVNDRERDAIRGEAGETGSREVERSTSSESKMNFQWGSDSRVNESFPS